MNIIKAKVRCNYLYYLCIQFFVFYIFTNSQMNIDMVNAETGIPNMKPIWVSWTLDDHYSK